MRADISLMPNDDDRSREIRSPQGQSPQGGSPLELSIRADPALDAAGWVRRHMVDPARAKETTELYQSLGFEVLSRNLTPDDFGPQCSACAADACRAYVLIYTRRKPRQDRGGQQPPQGTIQ